jgi:predicted RNase H-like HicB family nuclease
MIIIMEYVYPAVFQLNKDGSYTISYPDLPGCISEGKSLGNAMYMAQSALAQWIGYLEDREIAIPKASSIENLNVQDAAFINYICADVKDTHAVKRTISIPRWMDNKVKESGMSLSRVLQDTLTERFS